VISGLSRGFGLRGERPGPTDLSGPALLGGRVTGLWCLGTFPLVVNRAHALHGNTARYRGTRSLFLAASSCLWHPGGEGLEALGQARPGAQVL
jgi:hypothetical protein